MMHIDPDNQPARRHEAAQAFGAPDELRLDRISIRRDPELAADPAHRPEPGPEARPARTISSILSGALGRDFENLHPKVRERYSISSADSKYVRAEGVMDRVWNGSPLYYPFLLIGAQRNAMFPENGRNVPFEIENWAYRDSFGRETFSLNRTFSFPRERRFDEYIVIEPGAPQLVIYVGTHQHLAVELFPEITDDGGLRFRTGRQKLFCAGLSIRFPLLLSAEADIREWYDEKTDRLRIDGRVRNRLLGDVFCCTGSFTSETRPVPAEGIPARVLPKREERRW